MISSFCYAAKVTMTSYISLSDSALIVFSCPSAYIVLKATNYSALYTGILYIATNYGLLHGSCLAPYLVSSLMTALKKENILHLYNPFDDEIVLCCGLID